MGALLDVALKGRETEMKTIGILASIGAMVSLALLASPALAAGPIAGQADFTFVNPPCTIGGDHVELAGVETLAGVWTFAAALVNADPNLGCAAALNDAFAGPYSPSAADCVGTVGHNVCFGGALTVGANAVGVTICSGAFWGGCRASVGLGTVVRAS